jgi:hypothetical protein
MSELRTRMGEILAALAASDASCKRFGAAQHRYEQMPPLTDTELTQFEERVGGPLPDACSDYLDHVTRFSAGGVGPYYGLLPAQRAAAYVQKRGEIGRALPIAHLGCGYFAMMPIGGPAAGQIWLDAVPIDMQQMIAPSFAAFFLDWIDRVANNQWLEGYVPIGRCALQAALTGYLHMCEEGLGLGAGQLAGAQLRDALSGLSTGAIQIAAEGPLFRDGDTVDPCIHCARMLVNLVADGLAPDVVAPGIPPLPARSLVVRPVD